MKARTLALHAVTGIVLSVASTAVPAAGIFDFFTKDTQTSAKDQRAAKSATLPRCVQPLGTISIAPPDNQWWRGMKLESPEALIKLFIRRSGCFTILDRGRGYQAAMRERQLSQGGELEAGSEIAKRQIKAADFVLVPDIVSNNQNAGGSGLGVALGVIGNLVLPGIGALAAGVQTVDRNATVTLAVSDTRTTEEVAAVEGYAEKTDAGFNFGGLGISTGGFGAAGAGSYATTEAGQVIANAYLDAYAKLISRMGGQTQDAQQARPVDAPAAAASAPVPESKTTFPEDAGDGQVSQEVPQ